MSKKVKKPHQVENPGKNRKINTIEDPVNWQKLSPAWKFSTYDRNTPGNKWCVKSAFKEELFEKLTSSEGMTWRDIEQATHGRKNKSMHHEVHYSAMNRDASNRCIELKYDSLYSLRLNNKERLFGQRVGNVFEVIWYDSDHSVSKVKK